MKREQGNVSRKIIASLLLVAAVAAFFYGRILLAAPPVPVVTITAPSNGDAISGIIAVDADYSINAGNIHSLYLSVDGIQVDSVEVHARTGSYSFSLDASSLDDGSHEIAVEAYTAAKPSGHFSDDSITVNVVTPACSSDVDCDDSDNYTEDVCSDPGLVTAACSNQHIACLTAGDCDDSDNYTEDFCEDGVTSAASCVHNPITCLSDADCDDGITLTLDGCANSGTTSSSCSNDAIACNNDSDCDDTNAYTINSCVNGGTITAACESKTVACLSSLDCDDADNHTEDVCDNAGTQAAACAHSAIACISDTDCDDSNAITTDTCENAGTTSSSCTNVACPVICSSDADCDDSNVLTNDECANAGTCEADCQNTPCDYECAADSDCDDADAGTEDSCNGAGACGATCEHTQIVVEEPVVEEPVVEEPTVEPELPLVEEPVVEPEPPVVEEPVVETPEPPVVEEPVVEEPVVEHPPVVEEPDVITPEPPVVEEPPVQPLTLNILAPANGTLTNKGMITITGTTLAGATVEVGDVTVTAGGAGAFSAVVSLIEGNNTINILATNDSESITETLEVISDTIAPTVLSVSPLDGADLQETPTSITARLGDNPGGSGIVASSVRMELNGADSGCLYDEAAGTCAATALTIGNGAQTLVITAADAAGNVMTETTSFVVAGKGPRVKIVKVPGRTLQSSTGLAITDANQAITEIISTDNVTTEVDSSSSVQTTSQQETGATTTGNAFIDALKSKRHTFNEMKKRLTPKSPGWNLFGDAVKDANGNENAVIETPDLSALANSQTSALPELTLSGEIDATVEGTGAAIDPSTIEVTLNGKKIGHTFDPTTKKVKCSVKDLKRGTYEVTVTALDVAGVAGSATTAFGVDPIVTTITLENVDRSGVSAISVGELFSVAVNMLKDDGSGLPETGFTGAWIVLYNAESLPIGGEGFGSGDNWIGGPYELIEDPPMSGRYVASDYFYLSQDHFGNAVNTIRAAVPLDPQYSLYKFSEEALIVEDPKEPGFESPALENATNPSSKTINTGDGFTITQLASRGIQNIQYRLLDLDAVVSGINFEQAAVAGGTLTETAPGSGAYATLDPVAIPSFNTPAGTYARAVIGVTYPEYAPEYARGSNVLYVGPEEAPTFANLALGNRENPGQPIIPGTGMGSWYVINFQATGDMKHVPYYKVVLANADKIGPNWNAAYGTGAFIPGTLKTINEMVSMPDGVSYLAEGMLEGAVDQDGSAVTNIVAIVTAAQWFEYEPSNSVPVAGTTPEPTVTLDKVTLTNAEFPLGMTIANGERARLDAWGPQGLSNLMCEMTEGLFNVYGELDGFVLSAPMNEIEAGHYVCEAVISRLEFDGVPAQMLMSRVRDNNGNYLSDSGVFLTFRDDALGLLSEVHITNASRPGADGIAVGERFEITAKGEAGLTNLVGILIDAEFGNGGAEPFYFSDSVMEETVSGSYAIQGTLLAPPAGVTAIRGIAADMNEDGTFNVLPVLSTELLLIELAAPPAEPVISMIGGQDASGGTVSSPETSPLVQGTADANASVNIYEFVEGTGQEITPVDSSVPFYAEHADGSEYFGHDFTAQNFNYYWHFGYTQGIYEYGQTGDSMAVTLQPNSGVALDYDGSVRVDVSPLIATLKFIVSSVGISVPENTTFSQRFSVEVRGSETRIYTVDLSMGPSGRVSLRDDQGEICSSSFSSLMLDHEYSLSLEVSTSGPGNVKVLLDGTELLACDDNIPQFDSAWFSLFSSNSNTESLTVIYNRFETNIPILGYSISAPALSMIDANGDTVEYDAFGTGYGFYASPCNNDGPMILPGFDACTTGEKDIYAFLVTVYDVMTGPNGPPAPVLLGTFYSSGDPATQGNDQESYLINLLNIMKSQGFISGYSIDASAVALRAEGVAGGTFTPDDTIQSQQSLCTEVPASDGALTWDGSQYLASYTPLALNGTNYDEFVVFGLTPSNDAPVILNPGIETPIWWADGNKEIDAVVGTAQMGENAPLSNMTIYGTPDVINMVQGFGVNVVARAYGVFGTPEYEHGPYKWQASALQTPQGEITVKPQLQCIGGMFTILATTTAAPDGSFSATVGPFAAETSHVIVARASNVASSSSYSSPVTYNVGTPAPTDTTPPVITFTSHVDGELIGDNQPIVEAVITDDEPDASGVDWASLSCETSSGVLCAVEIVDETEGTFKLTLSTPIDDGVTVITLSAADNAGNISEKNLSIEIDASAPAISEVSISHNPFSPNGDGQMDATTISALISDPHFDAWKLYMPFDGTDYLSFATEGYSSDFQYTWAGKDGLGVIVDDAEYGYFLSAVDVFGNYSEAQGSIIVDNTAPTVNFEGLPSSFSRGLNNITLKIEDSSSISDANLLVNGVTSNSQCEEQSYAENVHWYNCVWDTTNYDVGSYTLSATAVDSVANPGNTQGENVVSIAPKYTPSISITSPATNAIIPVDNLASYPITVDFSVSGNPQVKGLKIIHKSTVTVLFEHTLNPPITDGTMTLSVNLSGLSDGPQQIIAEALTTSGESNISSPVEITIDRARPYVHILAPVIGDAIGGEKYYVKVKAADNTDVKAVRLLELDADGLNERYLVTCVSDGVESYGAYINTRIFVENRVQIVAEAEDIAGNLSREMVRVDVDNVAPSSPENFLLEENGQDLVFKWDAPSTNEDGSELSDVAGYNIYSVEEKNNCMELNVVPGYMAPMCSLYNNLAELSGPPMLFNETAYNQNPLGIDGAIWMDVNRTPVFYSMDPYIDAGGLNKTTPIYMYLLRLSEYGATQEYFITAYSQNNWNQVNEWIKELIKSGKYAYSSQIVAHAEVCFWEYNGTDYQLSPDSLPLKTIPYFSYSFFVSVSGNLNSYVLDAGSSVLGSTVFTVTSYDVVGNESEYSNMYK